MTSTTTSPTSGADRRVRVLVLAASRRAESFNGRLAALAARTAKASGAAVDLATLRDVDAPTFDADVLVDAGLPEGARAFAERLLAADGFIIASPEYNFSMPGGVKNLIDWASKHQPQPFSGKHGLLVSASPSLAGGTRGLWALRVPLEGLGARIYPEMFSLAQADTAFTPSGEIADAALAARLDGAVEGYLDLLEAARHYPAARLALAR